MSNPLIFSGATRNRHFDLSGCISYRYIFKKEVISRYCSTGLLQRSASGCVEVSCCEDKLLSSKSCKSS